MKKLTLKISIIFTFLALFLASTCTSFAAASFPDVPENHQNFAAIEFLKTKGIIQGYPDHTFQPSREINRAEGLKILLLSILSPLESTQKIAFPDVHTADWFYNYVRKAVELKIAEGYPDGKFRPENTINLAESLKVIALAFKADVSPSVGSDPYPDVTAGLWYRNFAHFGKQKNLVEAKSDGNLHAERLMSRAEFAEMVYRMMYTEEKKLDSFPISTNWPEFSHPTDHYSLQYPFSWVKMVAGNHTIFWKQDLANGQTSFARIFPNSATIYSVVDPNPKHLTLDQYLAKLQYDSSAVTKKSTVNGFPYASVVIDSNGLQDFYFELPNNKILILYTQMGNGNLKSQLASEIQAMAATVSYEASSTAVSAPQDLLSGIRQNLLVKGQGKTNINLLKDATIIETDTIGIGTGPVDYYFSATSNVTLKYERNSDTMLAMKDGKTTAF